MVIMLFVWIVYPLVLFIILVLGLILILLTACGKSEPPYIDNGNPGQIKTIVFYDDNSNGKMDADESGAQSQVAISQEVSCPPVSDPNWMDTDPNGNLLLDDLKPGKYCVFFFSNGIAVTTKLTQEVYVSSDAITEVAFGIVRD